MPHNAKRHQHASSLATAHRCGARTRSRSRPSRGRFDSRSVRVLKGRGGRCVSPVCFVRGLVLDLSLALLSSQAPDSGEQRLPGGIMSRAGSLEALARADPARLMVARARQWWWRTAGRSWWVFPPHPPRTRRAFSGCGALATCCAAQQHVQHHAPRRAAPRYWIASGPWLRVA